MEDAATAGAPDGADQTLAFFDAVFEAVPPLYRQVDKDYTQENGKPAKKGKQGAQEGVSLVELTQRAQDKIEALRKANALKSQAKIKQLTEQHQKDKKEGKGKPKKAQQAAAVVDEDAIGSSDEEEQAEETKRQPKGGKSANGKRVPLEGKAHVNKERLASAKLANKRKQKEAIKKLKQKRSKGAVGGGAAAGAE